MKNLSAGQKIGRLTLLELSRKKKGSRKRKVWSCKCDCGRLTEVTHNSLITKNNPTKSCGCLQKESVRKRTLLKIGKKYGKLVISELDRVVEYKSYWRCLCECGAKVTRRGDALNQKSSCGCDKVNYDAPVRSLYSAYRGNAFTKGVCFDINFNDFKKLTSLNCNYCGVEPSLLSVSYRNAYQYNGLDRKTPKLGYTLDNVVPCCKQCNFFKGARTQEEFFSLIVRILKKNPSLLAT